MREFNVLTDAYGAQYGKRPGAQVSIVTASGTNALHGSVYEFLRNSVLDARNFFDHGSIPQFERNVFGAALGGPIKKDKTFLFANFEGFRQRLGLSDVTLVPDANARAGYLPDSSGNLTFNGITPRAAALLALWPVANGPALGAGVAEAFSNPIQTIHENFGTVRLDHAFSDSDSLAAIYTVDDSADTTPSANPLSRASGGPSRAGGQRSGDPRFLSPHAEHGARGIFAGQLFLRQARPWSAFRDAWKAAPWAAS